MTTPDDASRPTAPGADQPDAMERRAFVRRMTSDAVGAAGRVFGLSRALTRGAVAAGQAMRHSIDTLAPGAAGPDTDAGPELEPPVGGQPAGAVPGATPQRTAGELGPPDSPSGHDVRPAQAPVDAHAATPSTEAAAPVAAPAAGPVVISASGSALRLTDAQRDLLAAATSAVLGVNGMDGPPLAVPISIHWDGTAVRFGSLGWSRRAEAIRRQPLVSLVVEDPSSNAFVVLEGRAEFVTGPGVRDAMGPLLGGADDPAEADRRWEALLAEDPDRVVITVRPTKVLPGRRA